MDGPYGSCIVLILSAGASFLLGSLLTALLIPILFVLSGKSTPLVLTSLIMAALVFFRLKANILRLIKGEERGWRRP